MAALSCPAAPSSCRAAARSSNSRRSNTVARAVPMPNSEAVKGVFQVSGAIPPSKLEYVEDAIGACQLTRGDQRRQCFEVFGLDAEKVDRYYPTVASMERHIVQEDEVGYQVVTSGGAGLLWVIAAALMRGGA